MSDVETELSRLKAIIRSPNSSLEQVEKANEVRNKLLQRMIEDAFNRIEARTALYTQLVDKLDDIVDDIKANRLTTVIDDVTALLNEVEEAASGGTDVGNG